METSRDSVDHFLAELATWRSDQQADDAATRRARTNNLVQLAEAEATFTGLLVDLAEQDVQIFVTLKNGRSFPGLVAAVAQDFVVLRNNEIDIFVRNEAIVSIGTPNADRGAAKGNRPAPSQMNFATVLSVLAEEQPRVVVGTITSPQPVAGSLLAAGEDVVTIQLDGSSAYLQLDNVLDVTVMATV